MATISLLLRRAAAISAPEPVKLRAMEGVPNMTNVGASMLVLSVVVWMTWLAAKPPSLFHATAAAPRYQTREPGGSPYLQVYRDRLAIGSVYWIARIHPAGAAPPASAAAEDPNG